MAKPKTLPFDASQPTPGLQRLALLVCIGQSHRPLQPMARVVDLRGVRQIRIGRADQDRLQRAEDGPLAFHIDDPWMSNQHASIRMFQTASEQLFVLQDEGSTNGTRVNGKQLKHHQLTDGDIIETGQTFWRFIDQDVEHADDLLALAHQGGEISPMSTVSLSMLRCLEPLRKVADTEIPVIFEADTGTGKEVMAAELHRLSGRTGRFVVLNCPAIPDGLIESELFGHARGSFTGATVEKQGLVEEAHQGTLLLDEIGDMPAAAQAKVLRLLQDSTFIRVGETRLRKVDVRFIAATHHDLRRKVAEGTFRADLHARLSGHTCRLPSLRQRVEDIGLLLAVFLKSVATSGQGLTLDQAVFRALCLHPWPYNIRELEQTVRSALALAGGSGAISLSRLPARGRPLAGPAEDPARSWPGEEARTRPLLPRARRRKLSDEELRRTLERTLSRTGGNISAAARELDTSRMQVHRWLKRLDIAPDSFR